MGKLTINTTITAAERAIIEDMHKVEITPENAEDQKERFEVRTLETLAELYLEGVKASAINKLKKKAESAKTLTELNNE